VKFPFEETKINENIKIRSFSVLKDTNELIWHRDREDREVFVIEANGWSLQMDNEIPVLLENSATYHIPARTFHRVIKGFMAQGGGFASGMDEKDSRTAIQNEANNGLGNARGTLAMARTQDPHSASAQFFINLADNDFLNFKSEDVQGWGYCVFAKVVEGMDIVDKMTLVDTGRMGFHDDVPKEEIIIEETIVA
jgi:peptidyl-prolyl cis-trans isomerase B (cyclophilin B)